MIPVQRFVDGVRRVWEENCMKVASQCAKVLEIEGTGVGITRQAQVLRCYASWPSERRVNVCKLTTNAAI